MDKLLKQLRLLHGDLDIEEVHDGIEVSLTDCQLRICCSDKGYVWQLRQGYPVPRVVDASRTRALDEGQILELVTDLRKYL